MARLPLLDIGQLGPIGREMFQKSLDATGKVLNLFRVLAHSEKIARDWNRMGTTLLQKGRLPADLRELAIIRVGELARSRYELAAHRAIGRRAGLRQAQIDAIADWRTSQEFNATERLVLQYTDEVALQIAASDSTFARLKETFSAEEIVELTVNIGFYGMVVRTLETLQVDPEP